MTRIEDVKRFRQAVRKAIREHVAREKEAPPLTAWVSAGANPRKVAATHVGAAEDALDVKARIIYAVREHESSFCAVGRLLTIVDPDDESLHPTAVFGLAVMTGDYCEMWEADAVAGRLGSWRAAVFATTRDRQASMDDWFFCVQAIRSVERTRVEGF